MDICALIKVIMIKVPFSCEVGFMSLRKKTLIIIGAILAGLIVILLIASQTCRCALQLEEQHAREDVPPLNALSDHQHN
jgi:sensor domain CHASE-containing protein